MSGPYKLYGAELSPYSQKVRAYLTYKGARFEWLQRSQSRQEEFQRYAKLPLVPVLVDADDQAMQDSTPIIEALEREIDEPSILPDDPSLAFISALLEDYADEWLNKAMFHYRWSRNEDAVSAARRLVDGMFDGAEPPNRDAMEEVVRERMVGRLRHVGSNADTAPVIEQSLLRVLDQLEAHLEHRDYLLGGRPALADFGIAAQLAQLLSDPTPGALMRERAPRVVGWIERMNRPRAGGGFEEWGSLASTLSPLLRTEVSKLYLPWMAANAEGVADDASNVDLELDGRRFTQGVQRYAAKAFSELQRKRALVEDEKLQQILEDTDCAAFFSADAQSDDDGDEDGGE